MIYGNKFYGYGINNITLDLLEADYNNILLLSDTLLTEEAVLTESVNLKELFSKAFGKIREWLSKILELIDKALTFIYKKLDGLIIKLIAALKKSKDNIKESAVVTESDNESNEGVKLYKITNKANENFSKFEIAANAMGYKLSSIMSDMAEKTMDIVEKFKDSTPSASDRKEVVQECEERLDKFLTEYKTLEDKYSDVIDFFKNAKLEDIYDITSTEVDLKTESGITRTIQYVEYSADALKSIKQTYSDTKKMIDIIDKKYLHDIQDLFDEMTAAAATKQAKAEYKKDQGMNESEFQFMNKFTVQLYNLSTRYFSTVKTGLNNVIRLLQQGLNNTASPVVHIGKITAKLMSLSDLEKMCDDTSAAATVDKIKSNPDAINVGNKYAK